MQLSIIYLIRHILDNKTIDGYNYLGFPLYNYEGSSVYSQVTVDECQYLCQITDLCRYFNYGSDKFCNLKFGVGKKVYKYGGSFGYKNSSGIRMDLDQCNIIVYFS